MTRRRPFIIALMLVSLLASALLRQYSETTRKQVQPTTFGATGSRTTTTSFASMSSFALALMLGGLRGPLVMILWSSSESQKADRNLEDFDTKVEWIRMLQPEFDTVHIFQIWNKAYNISVQMAGLSSKYSVILDAINYGKSVDAERPDNINIIYSISQIYFHKLGESQEKEYYRKRVRDDSLPHAKDERATGDTRYLPTRMDSLLDENGNILPEYLVVRYPRPADRSPELDWYDGSELQYLPRYQPYPYGVSTFALAYNHTKRAQVLQEVNKQKHAQHGPSIINSRPATSLRDWAHEEILRGRRAELDAFGLQIPEERREMELPAANWSLDKPPVLPARLDEAIYSYDMTHRLMNDTLAELNRHIRTYEGEVFRYQSHMLHAELLAALAAGDRDYLKALRADPADRAAHVASARSSYQLARNLGMKMILRYYVEDEIAARVYPRGITRDTIVDLDPSFYEGILARVGQIIATERANYDAYAEDRGEYEGYIDRAASRLALLK